MITRVERSKICSLRLVYLGNEYEPYECLANFLNLRLVCLAHKGNYGFMLYLGDENEGKDEIVLPQYLDNYTPVEGDKIVGRNLIEWKYPERGEIHEKI